MSTHILTWLGPSWHSSWCHCSAAPASLCCLKTSKQVHFTEENLIPANNQSSRRIMVGFYVHWFYVHCLIYGFNTCNILMMAVLSIAAVFFFFTSRDLWQALSLDLANQTRSIVLNDIMSGEHWQPHFRIVAVILLLLLCLSMFTAQVQYVSADSVYTCINICSNHVFEFKVTP